MSEADVLTRAPDELDEDEDDEDAFLDGWLFIPVMWCFRPDGSLGRMALLYADGWIVRAFTGATVVTSAQAAADVEGVNVPPSAGEEKDVGPLSPRAIAEMIDVGAPAVWQAGALLTRLTQRADGARVMWEVATTAGSVLVTAATRRDGAPPTIETRACASLVEAFELCETWTPGVQ